jgi:hypothetical protein
VFATATASPSFLAQIAGSRKPSPSSRRADPAASPSPPPHLVSGCAAFFSEADHRASLLSPPRACCRRPPCRRGPSRSVPSTTSLHRPLLHSPVRPTCPCAVLHCTVVSAPTPPPLSVPRAAVVRRASQRAGRVRAWTMWLGLPCSWLSVAMGRTPLHKQATPGTVQAGPSPVQQAAGIRPFALSVSNFWSLSNLLQSCKFCTGLF